MTRFEKIVIAIWLVAFAASAWFVVMAIRTLLAFGHFYQVLQYGVE